MCQFSKNCTNFQKHPRNSTACMVFCTRNPLLNYEVPDFFKPLKPLSAEEKELEKNIDFGTPAIMNQPVDMDKLIKQVKEIEADKNMTKGQKREAIQDLYIEKGAEESFGGVTIDTQDINFDEEAHEPVKSTKEQRERAESEEVMKESFTEKPYPTGDYVVPKRRRKKLDEE